MRPDPVEEGKRWLRQARRVIRQVEEFLEGMVGADLA